MDIDSSGLYIEDGRLCDCAAAEARLGRQLTNEEFERDHWVEPDSEIQR